jgi:transcription elongation factor GreA
MTDQDSIQYLTEDKHIELKEEYKTLKEEKIPEIANRIDEARQMGDLSENAEYHQAREEMAWAQGRLKEIDYILQHAKIISEKGDNHNTVDLGSTIVVEVNDKEKTYTIVGAQEANPLEGKISNESPLGQAFLGKELEDVVEVGVPAGRQQYKIVKIF